VLKAMRTPHHHRPMSVSLGGLVPAAAPSHSRALHVQPREPASYSAYTALPIWVAVSPSSDPTEMPIFSGFAVSQ